MIKLYNIVNIHKKNIYNRIVNKTKLLLTLSQQCYFREIKFFLFLVIILLLMWKEPTYCGTLSDENNTTILQNYVRGLNPQELDDFERRLDLNIQRGWNNDTLARNTQGSFGWEALGLFIIGTISIIIIARHGHQLWDGITTTINNIATGISDFFVQIGHAAAQHRVASKVANYPFIAAQTIQEHFQAQNPRNP